MNTMSKVYIVTYQSHGKGGVAAIASTKEKADEFESKVLEYLCSPDDIVDIEEWSIDTILESEE